MRSVQRVIEQQTTNQRFADTGDELDHFHCLQAADHAWQHAKHARFCASGDSSRRRRFREEIAIRGILRAVRTGQIRHQHCHCAIKAAHRAGYQRSPDLGRRIRQHIARCEVIGAIDNHIVIGNQRFGIVRVKAQRMAFDRYMRIDARNGVSRALDLFLTDAFRVMDDLSLEIGQRNRIVVDDAERPDARSRQILQHGRSETTRTDNQYTRCLQLLLARAADFRQHDMPRIAFKFFGRKWSGWCIDAVSG
jgi:hypothetical protein